MAFPVVPVALGTVAALVLGYTLMKGKSEPAVKKSGTAPTGSNPKLATAKGLADGKEAGEFDFVSGLPRGDSGPSASKATASGDPAAYNAAFKQGYDVGYDAAKLTKGGLKGISDVIGTFGVGASDADVVKASSGDSTPAANAAYGKKANEAGELAGQIDGTRDAAERPIGSSGTPNCRPDPGATSFYRTCFCTGGGYGRGYMGAYDYYFAKTQDEKRSSAAAADAKKYSTDSVTPDATPAESDDSESWVSGLGTRTGRGPGSRGDYGGGGGGGSGSGGARYAGGSGAMMAPPPPPPSGGGSAGGGGNLPARPTAPPSGGGGGMTHDGSGGRGSWGPRHHALYRTHGRRYAGGGWGSGFFNWWPWGGGDSYEEGFRLGIEDCRFGLERDMGVLSMRMRAGYIDGYRSTGCGLMSAMAYTGQSVHAPSPAASPASLPSPSSPSLRGTDLQWRGRNIVDRGLQWQPAAINGIPGQLGASIRNELSAFLQKFRASGGANAEEMAQWLAQTNILRRGGWYGPAGEAFKSRSPALAARVLAEVQALAAEIRSSGRIERVERRGPSMLGGDGSGPVGPVGAMAMRGQMRTRLG